MARLWQRWRREMARRMTVMVVPHGSARPRQMTFSLPFLTFLFVFWTAFTGWAGYIASERFDYWRARATNHFLRLKVGYFQAQLAQSRAMLEDVKSLESDLRSLVGLGSRDAIIETDVPLPAAPGGDGAGGPTESDAAALERLLTGAVTDLDMDSIAQEIRALREEAEQRLAGAQALSEKILEERRRFRHTPNIWPVTGYLTSPFGRRASPIDGVMEHHNGLDIAAPAGSPVRATADGVVRLAGWAGGYGKVVVLDHDTGHSTRYGHNRQLLVKKGDRVRRGQTIALVGNTGKATGAHCHYEVWYNGRAVNPRKYLEKQGT